MAVEPLIFIDLFCVCVMCRTVVAIDSYEGPSKKSESAEARYPDIYLSDFW